MNKLLKDAIADAKAVRETALANAKAALEEAFAPKLQSMLSHKIKEEMADDEEGVEVSDEEQMEVAKMQQMAGIVSEEDDEMDAEEAPAEDEMDAEEAPAEDEMGDEEDYESEEEVSDEDLEEILRELEGEEAPAEEEEMKMEAEDEKDMEAESEDPEAKEMDEEIDLDEIIKALKEEDEVEEEEEETEAKMESVTSELNEAYGVIKFLRTKLNEVNLLNAKLLYVNKLFRKGELTESQKVKIIETFDRAKNVREAKLIYATLSESVSGKSKKSVTPKKKMNEGFASAPQKSTNIISESNNLYNRFKSLVDYNKH
jgi:hypothetical protein